MLFPFAVSFVHGSFASPLTRSRLMMQTLALSAENKLNSVAIFENA